MTLRDYWNALSVYRGIGNMTTGAIINLILSALAAGFVTFVTATTAGSTNKVAISTAISATLTAAVNHLRGTPLDSGAKTSL